MERAPPELTPKPASAPVAEQRLADLLRLSPGAVLVVRDDRIEFASQAAAELFGVAAPEALLGRSPLGWFHPDDQPAIRARIGRLLGGQPSVPRHLVTVVRGDGTARRAEGAATAFEDERGRALQVVLHDVTDRERFERELREANRRLTDILESITDAFYAVDAGWRLTYVNRRTEALWQRTREALVGQVLWDLFPDAQGGEGSMALRRAMRDRAPAHVEVYSAYLDQWVETFAYPSADGGLSVFFQDISARKRALDAAHESELRARARAAELQAVLDTVPAAVWIAQDPLAERILTNRFGAELLGRPPGAGAEAGGLLSERPTGFRMLRDGLEIPPDQRPMPAAARRGEAIRDCELELVFDDGTTRHLLGNAVPLLDAAGERHGAVGAFIDVTERRRVEARLRLVTESLPQLVWTADADGRLDYFNQRWRDYTGQAAGAEAWEPALHPEDRERVVALWDEAVARRGDFELEHRLRRADGEYRWFLRRAFPLREGGAPSVRWFGTCTDIHDLKVSQELLRQADRLKEDFLGMASHEFRTPLTALRLQVELLRRALRKGDQAAGRAEHHLQVIDAQAGRLQALLGTLLDVSRLHAGRLTLDLAEVDLPALAAEVVERLEPDAERAGTPLQLRSGPVTGRWDRARLDQVLTNLVSNAIKYGDRRPVSLEVGASGGEATVVVRDAGIGIAPADLPAIFDRFERAGNAGHVHGLGLGLWIVRRLVEAHGGRVTVESALGAGTSFTVRLPLDPPREP